MRWAHHGRRQPQSLSRAAQVGQVARTQRQTPPCGQAAGLRGPGAPGQHAPLRLPARGRRRAQVVGGAEGPVDRPARQAARHPGRGPSAGLRRVRGRDSAGRVRRRLGDRLGPRHLRQHHREGRQAAAGRAGAGRRPSDGRVAWPEAVRRLRAAADQRRRRREMAARQDARRACRCAAPADFDPAQIRAERTQRKAGGRREVRSTR